MKHIVSRMSSYFPNRWPLCEPTYNFFQNHDLPTLNEQEKQKCEGLLTDKECESAIKDMKNGKSPGSDGLTVNFIKYFGKISQTPC